MLPAVEIPRGAVRRQRLVAAPEPLADQASHQVHPVVPGLLVAPCARALIEFILTRGILIRLKPEIQRRAGRGLR